MYNIYVERYIFLFHWTINMLKLWNIPPCHMCICILYQMCLTDVFWIECGKIFLNMICVIHDRFDKIPYFSSCSYDFLLLRQSVEGGNFCFFLTTYLIVFGFEEKNKERRRHLNWERKEKEKGRERRKKTKGWRFKTKREIMRIPSPWAMC